MLCFISLPLIKFRLVRSQTSENITIKIKWKAYSMSVCYKGSHCHWFIALAYLTDSSNLGRKLLTVFLIGWNYKMVVFLIGWNDKLHCFWFVEMTKLQCFWLDKMTKVNIISFNSEKIWKWYLHWQKLLSFHQYISTFHCVYRFIT